MVGGEPAVRCRVHVVNVWTTVSHCFFVEVRPVPRPARSEGPGFAYKSSTEQGRSKRRDERDISKREMRHVACSCRGLSCRVPAGLGGVSARTVRVAPAVFCAALPSHSFSVEGSWLDAGWACRSLVACAGGRLDSEAHGTAAFASGVPGSCGQGKGRGGAWLCGWLATGIDSRGPCLVLRQCVGASAVWSRDS